MRKASIWLLLLGVLSLALGQGLEAKLKQAEALRRAREAEAARIAAELKDLDAQTQSLRNQIARLNAELAGLARRLAALQARIRALEEEVRRLQEEEAKKEKAYEQRVRELAALLDLLWRVRAAGKLPAVRATSFAELAVKRRWLASLGAAELELAQKVRAEARELASLKRKKIALLEARKRALEEAEAQRRALQSKQQELRGLLAQLEAHKKAKTLRLAELERAKRQLDAEIARLKKALEAERARARAAALGVPKALVGQLLFPIAGGRIVKRFGQEGQEFEWIRAPRPGAPVRAAGSGEVFAVFYYGNVGWTVLIRHSPGLFTQYVNLQEPPVATGDHVEQGEVIGYLGGGALIPPDVLWFRVVLWKDGRFYYADPDPYF